MENKIGKYRIIIETTTTQHTITFDKNMSFGDWLNFMDDVIYDLLYKNNEIEPYEKLTNFEVIEI